MSKWIEIEAKHFDKLVNHECLYKPYAGGRMLSGGTYTEYTPHSALSPRWPDLRVEMQGLLERETVYKYFVLSEHDPRD